MLEENNNQFIEIIVESYPNPVNYKGQYHYRSGSTKQELKGAALDKFLLQRHGKTWDSVPVPKITVEDLDNNAFNIFRKKAKNSGRVDDDVLNDSNTSLLENLDLLEENYLTRAGILLFHSKPDKYFTGSFIKIGFFTTDDDLRFQDEVQGNIFDQIEKTLDLLKTKYLKAEIRYEGASRIEEFPFPPTAFREALLNAIAHKDYSSTTPIQISVYEDKMIFWNQGQLPENWTVDKLTEKHPSIPYNPNISNALFRSGYIEAWGRGTINMRTECVKRNLLLPKYKLDYSGFIVEFRKYSKKSLEGLGLKESFVKIILFIQGEGRITNTQVQDICKVSKRSASNYLAELEKTYLDKKGSTGKGTYYILKGQ